MSETKAYDGKLVTNTLAGLHVQTTKMLGLPMAYKEKSTLNEHLSILKDQLPDADLIPNTVYLCVGNKGHVATCDDEDDGFATMIPIRHQPTDAAPYNIQPLVLRPVDNDLSDVERERYALRKLEEHGGKNYWAYYLKRLDYRGVETKDYYTRIRDGQKTVTEFEYSDLNLYPKPPQMPDYDYEVSDQVVPEDGDYVHSAATVRIVMDDFDVQEYLNVAKIIYGDPRKAVISEFCLCSGVDTQATGESMVGSPFQYLECIGTQVNVFLTTFVNLAFNNGGIAYDLEIGQTEPMVLAPGQVPNQIG